MDHPLEASRQRTVASALNPKVRTDLIQMSKNFPEQFFRHACVTVPVRVGQTITARGNAIPNFAYQTAMISKRIADVVQPHLRPVSEERSSKESLLYQGSIFKRILLIAAVAASQYSLGQSCFTKSGKEIYGNRW
jgi:hypothetical protein